MALWGRKEIKEDDLPEELRGKSPEEIAKFIKDSAELRATLDQMQTERDGLKTQIDSQRTEFDGMKAKLAELEANAANANQQNQPPDADEPASIWTDPDKWHAERNRGVENVALMSGMLTARMAFENSLSGNDRNVWRKYTKEIDQTMNGFTPVQRTLPQSWGLALNVVKGNHMNDILKAQSEGTDFFAEGSSGHNPPASPDEVKLTAQEEEACEKFHWDPKRYLAQKKKMVTSQSDRGAYAHFGVD